MLRAELLDRGTFTGWRNEMSRNSCSSVKGTEKSLMLVLVAIQAGMTVQRAALQKSCILPSENTGKF